MIAIRCLHDLALAEPFRDAMNGLNLASDAPDPFSTFEFYALHQQNAERFPEQGRPQLWLLLGFAGDELVGYAALKRETHRVLGVSAARIGWLTAHQASQPHLVVADRHAGAVRDAVYAYLLGRRSEWSLLEFEQQEARSALAPPPVEAGRGAHRSRTWPNMSHGVIPIRWSTTAAYCAALSQKARSNVGRQMRNLLEAGEVELLTSADPAVTPALFELYCDLATRSWKARAEEQPGLSPQWRDYYARLLDASQPMRAVIQVLTLDGVPVAGMISIHFGRLMYALHTAYDDRLGPFAPGSAIILLCMRLAIAQGCEALDLLWGFGYYKARWLAQMSPSHSLQIVRVGSPYWWRQRLASLWRVLRRSPVESEPAEYNPMRKRVAPIAWTYTQDSREAFAGAEARAGYDALLRTARAGQGEFLSAAALAAVLPFATRRRDSVRATPSASVRCGTEAVAGRSHHPAAVTPT